MGNKSSSSSTVNQTYNTNVVSESDLKLLNKQLNQYASDTVIKSAASCSAGINQLQNVKFSNIKTAGDFNIGDINQKQGAAITFKCVNSSEIQSEIATGLASTMMQDLQNNYNTSVLDEINTNAKSGSTTGFGSGIMDSNSSASTVNTKYNFSSLTSDKKNIQNIVENSINNNFQQETVQECINIVNNNQNIEFQNLDIGGSVNIKAINQEQAAQVIAECQQLSSGINKVVSSIANDLGLKVVSESEVTKSTKATTETKAETTSTGFFQGLGQMISSIFGSILTGPVLIVVAIIAVLVFVFMMFKPSGDKK